MTETITGGYVDPQVLMQKIDAFADRTHRYCQEVEGVIIARDSEPCTFYSAQRRQLLIGLMRKDTYDVTGEYDVDAVRNLLLKEGHIAVVVR